eukprot:3151860-Amphidinium_carterae.1
MCLFGSDEFGEKGKKRTVITLVGLANISKRLVSSRILPCRSLDGQSLSSPSDRGICRKPPEELSSKQHS